MLRTVHLQYLLRLAGMFGPVRQIVLNDGGNYRGFWPGKGPAHEPDAGQGRHMKADGDEKGFN